VEKIIPISFNLNFTPNTSGCYGLMSYFHRKHKIKKEIRRWVNISTRVQLNEVDFNEDSLKSKKSPRLCDEYFFGHKLINKITPLRRRISPKMLHLKLEREPCRFP